MSVVRSGLRVVRSAFILTMIVALPVAAQQPRPAPRPAPPARPPARGAQPPAPATAKPPAAPELPDLIVKIQHVSGDDTTTSTISGNGKRQRVEFGAEMTAIAQCDAGNVVHINETQKRFLVKPLEEAAAPESTSTATKGGTITYTTTVVDTGERKQMFGTSARHLKTTLTRTPDANACDKKKEIVETDGWFVDVPPALACSTTNRRQSFASTDADCRDTITYVDATTPVGYPLAYTVTTTTGENKPTVMTMSVTAWDRQKLSDTLFTAPEGYTEVKTLAQFTADARTGIPKVGVLRLTTKVKDEISLGALSEALAISLSEAGVDAFLLEATTPAAALTEARSKSADFILTSQVVDINRPSRGMLGRVTGSREFGARIDYVFTVPGAAAPRLSKSERSGASTLQTAVTTARNVSRYMTPFGLLSSQFKFMSTFTSLTGEGVNPSMTQSSDPVLNTVFSLLGTAPEKPEGELLQSEDAAVAAALEKIVEAIATDLKK
jgi:hypothetical protein